MLTVLEAQRTWCPMVRIARHETVRTERPATSSMNIVTEEHHIVGGCNTDALGGNRVPGSCRCIADRCAMWRWEPKNGPSVASGHPALPPAPGPRLEPTHGYCGLAGRPV